MKMRRYVHVIEVRYIMRWPWFVPSLAHVAGAAGMRVPALSGWDLGQPLQARPARPLGRPQAHCCILFRVKSHPTASHPTLTLTSTSRSSRSAKLYFTIQKQTRAFPSSQELKMAVYDYVSGTIDSARRQADRVVSPHDRQKAYDSVLSFAQEQPLLFVCRFWPFCRVSC